MEQKVMETPVEEKVVSDIKCEKCGSRGIRHKKGCSEIEVKQEEVSKSNFLEIENLSEVMEKVKADMEEKKINPSVLLEDEVPAGFINGEPHIVIDNNYIPYDKAQIILQTRKVVREYVKLQNLIKGIKEE